MKKVGVVVAIESEALFKMYNDLEKLDCPKGYDLFHRKNGDLDTYFLRSGMGEVFAAAGTQYLIDSCNVDIVVNFGVVGGLTHDMKLHRICVVDKVIHYRYDASEFLPVKKGQVPEHDIEIKLDKNLVNKALQINEELITATCASGDKFVGTEKEKREIHETFNADICDMESVGIVLTCELNNIPCLMLKGVSDGLTGGAGEFFEELTKAALICLKTADEIIKNM